MSRMYLARVTRSLVICSPWIHDLSLTIYDSALTRWTQVDALMQEPSRSLTRIINHKL
jgi:hypothetical protein